jgi:uncharacterized protein YcgL (UPF0745 family)
VLSLLPGGLLQLLGELHKVVEVDLHAQRKLAQADIDTVMRQIEERGYYLQMPQAAKQQTGA